MGVMGGIVHYGATSGPSENVEVNEKSASEDKVTEYV